MQNKFGKYLKNQRKLKKVTQEVLASRLRVSTVYIHQLETAKVDAPSKDKCFKIANALEISPEDVWSNAKDHKLLRFLNKENIISSIDEPITSSEKLLLDLFRNLDSDVRKDFIGMIFMLLKSDKRVTSEILDKVTKLTKSA